MAFQHSSELATADYTSKARSRRRYYSARDTSKTEKMTLFLQRSHRAAHFSGNNRLQAIQVRSAILPRECSL